MSPVPFIASLFMPALAITGIIGSGKSMALELLCNSLTEASKNIIRFSADEENHRLLDENDEVKALISSRLGDSCYQSNGKADRSRLFELISGNSNAKQILEEILHSRLEQLWKPLAAKCRNEQETFFIAEIPLLYEKGLEVFFNKIVVVGCSDALRRERLQRERSMTPAKASCWINMQHSQDEKISRADYLLWNDGPREALALQIHQFIVSQKFS